MVLFVSSHAKRGGAENYLERLLDGLGPSFPAQLVSLESGPFALRVNSLVIETGPDVTDIIRSAIRLHTLVRRERPDVIHANGLKAGVVSGLATLGTRIGQRGPRRGFAAQNTGAKGQYHPDRHRVDDYQGPRSRPLPARTVAWEI